MNRPVTACCRSHGCSSSTSTVRERRAASSDHQQSSTTGARQFLLITLSLPSSNKYVGPPYRRTKMYAARWSRGNSSCRSISAGCPRLTSAANPPAAAAAVDRRKRQKDGRTDEQTDGQTFYRFMTLYAYCANRVITSTQRQQ